VYIYTDLEPFHCHTYMPCFDQPDLKASLALRVKLLKSYTALGNTPILDTQDVDEFRITTFKPTPKLST